MVAIGPGFIAGFWKRFVRDLYQDSGSDLCEIYTRIMGAICPGFIAGFRKRFVRDLYQDSGSDLFEIYTRILEAKCPYRGVRWTIYRKFCTCAIFASHCVIAHFAIELSI